MALYGMKIRSVFLSAIREGRKTHEYRLASPERMQIRIGDEIKLVDNDDEKNFLVVTVTGIEVFSSWRESFEGRWQQELCGIYSSLEEAEEACSTFYPADEVEKYGIVAFEIKVR